MTSFQFQNTKFSCSVLTSHHEAIQPQMKLVPWKHMGDSWYHPWTYWRQRYAQRIIFYHKSCTFRRSSFSCWRSMYAKSKVLFQIANVVSEKRGKCKEWMSKGGSVYTRGTWAVHECMRALPLHGPKMSTNTLHDHRWKCPKTANCDIYLVQ